MHESKVCETHHGPAGEMSVIWLAQTPWGKELVPVHVLCTVYKQAFWLIESALIINRPIVEVHQCPQKSNKNRN